MPDDIYHRDVLTWSERQADLLRRLAAGERVNDVVDWENVIEEIETVGRSELHACESLLEQALLHLLKLAAWPGSPAAPHWRTESLAFLLRARRVYRSSMRQHLDAGSLYNDARLVAEATTDPSGAARPLPAECPFTLAELLEAGTEPLAYLPRLERAGGLPALTPPTPSP